MLAGGAIVYISKTQTVTALSSTEAEFYAELAAAKQALYIRSILNDILHSPNEPTTIYEENEATIDEYGDRWIPVVRKNH